MSSIVVACANDRVIGSKNDLPWYIPADLKHFRDITRGHAIIMGSNTYKSIYDRRHGPLPDRRNIVMSRSLKELPPGFELASSFDDVARFVDLKDESVFIIGGAQIYEAALKVGIVDKIYLTVIHAEIKGDTYFPELSDDWVQEKIESHHKDDKNTYDYDFIELGRK